MNKKNKYLLINFLLLFILFLSFNKPLMLFASNEDTYTYTKGDGEWLIENEVRLYETSKFKFIHRKNNGTSNIDINQSYIKLTGKHSIEVITKDESIYINQIDFIATSGARATNMKDNVYVEAYEINDNVVDNVLGTINGQTSNVVNFDFSSLDYCKFAKFTLDAITYINSINITYDYLPEPHYEYQFSSEDFSNLNIFSNEEEVLLNDVIWKVDSTWDTSTYYIEDNNVLGLQIGEENNTPSYLNLRSELLLVKVNKVVLNVKGNLDTLLTINIGGHLLGDTTYLSNDLDTFIFESDEFYLGHLELEFSQNKTNLTPLYLHSILIYGEVDLHIIEAINFAKVIEEYDACGSGEDFHVLLDLYQNLSEESKTYLSVIKLDDYNNFGQDKHLAKQKNIITAEAKWAYLNLRFNEEVLSLDFKENKQNYFAFILIISILGISLLSMKVLINKKGKENI